MSYSWDDDEHRLWVRDLAARLRGDGIETLLDQWHLVPGDRLPAFMETSVRECDFALIVCTPRYKQRSDSRAGGVGYEGDIMTGEVYVHGNARKFIPLLARGPWSLAAPSWLLGRLYLDFTTTPPDTASYNDLVTTILGRWPQPPPVGELPLEVPPLTVEALFGNQDTLTVSPISRDFRQGYSSFTWPAAYAVNNMSRRDFTITGIENVLTSVRLGEHELLLRQTNGSHALIIIYDDFGSLLHDGGATERLPWTIRAGVKQYLKVMGDYDLLDHGHPVFFKNEQDGYQLLTAALGAELGADGSRPGIVKTFETHLALHGHGKLVSSQRTILLTPGCKINLQPLLDSVVVTKKDDI